MKISLVQTYKITMQEASKIYDFFPRENISHIKYKDVKPYIYTEDGLTLEKRVFLISIFLGYFGVDRLILKDTKNGLMKLAMACLSFLIIPGIVAIVWWVKDLFNIKEMVKLFNYNLMRTVSRIY